MKPIDHTPIVKKYPGKWVVLDKSLEKVLAADDTLRGALDKFRKKFGDREIPATFKVPTELIPFVGTGA